MEGDSRESDRMLNRRQYVTLVGASSIALAGCSGGGDDDGNSGDGDGGTSDGSDGSDGTDGGDGTDGEDETDSGDETDGEDETDEQDEESVLAPKTFSGSGNTSGEPVQMEEGLVVAESTHDGSGTFEITLDGGQLPKYLADADGGFDGKEAVYTDEREYTLNVVADGSWELTIRQPRADSGDSVPVSYTGSGSDVVGPVDLPEEVTARFSNTSSEFNAAVTVYPQIIDTASPLFGFVGPNSDAETLFPGAGISWVDIDINTDSDWTLEFE